MAQEKGFPADLQSPSADFQAPSADFQSPYYISPTDRLTDVIVHFPLSPDGKNYPRWAESMVRALVFKGKHVFIDGSMPMPERDSHDFAMWSRCDDLVKAWICNSIEWGSNLFRTSTYAKSAKDLWADLEQLFNVGISARIYEVMAEIGRLKQGGLTVAEYYTELSTLWNELDCYMPGCTCECGAAEYKKVKDNQRLCQFLIGLESDRYQAAKFRILSSEPLPSLREAYSMVVLEEELAAMRI